VNPDSAKVDSILHTVSDQERLRLVGESLIAAYGEGVEAFDDTMNMFTSILDGLHSITAGVHPETCKLNRAENILERLMSNGRNEHISRELSGLDGSDGQPCA
jgi:hypothetical protein